jgi:hypothetical protein
VPVFTGLSVRKFRRLVWIVAGRSGEQVGTGRRWSLPLADRVLLIAVYYRTNLTLRQVALLFGAVEVGRAPRRPHRGRPGRQGRPGGPSGRPGGEEDVPGTSFADALRDLVAAHAAASGDGPHGDLVAAAAAVVRSRPPYLTARGATAQDRPAAGLPG